MMMSNERLRLIGRMIGIYREERRANSQNCWTQKRFCKDICSPNTLKSIENGGLARSIEVYIELLDKLDLKLGEFTAIDEAVIKLTGKLYIALDYYRIDEAITILNKILRILDKVSDYVYYSELKVLFESVYDYYKYDVFIDDDELAKFKQIINIMPDDFTDLYRVLIYVKTKTFSISSKSNFESLINEINLENSKTDFVKIGLLNYYYISDKYIKMKELLNYLEIAYEKRHNTIRLIDIYESAIIMLSRIEYDKCLEYIEKAKRLISKETIPNVKIGELYSNIARAYHINNKYDLALENYHKMLNYERQTYLNSLIFMADCQNRLNKAIDIPRVDTEAYNQYPNDLRIMYKYFTFGKDYPDFSKENYILKKIVPNLTDNDFIDVFRFELMRLVNKTNHYKAMHTFELKIKENTVI